MNKIELIYVNIDDWNHPIFKDNKNNYYGATDILFPYEEPESSVKEKVTINDLTYFGSRFNCEPMGTDLPKNAIIKWGV